MVYEVQLFTVLTNPMRITSVKLKQAIKNDIKYKGLKKKTAPPYYYIVDFL